MDGWLEGDGRGNGAADIDQAQLWVIDHEVRAAFGAITAVADLAALELTQELCAFGHFHVVDLPQGERADRRARILSAIAAMAVTHVERGAARLDLDRAAVTSAGVRLCHAPVLTRDATRGEQN